jgi:hypothetical protein
LCSFEVSEAFKFCSANFLQALPKEVYPHPPSEFSLCLFEILEGLGFCSGFVGDLFIFFSISKNCSSLSTGFCAKNNSSKKKGKRRRLFCSVLFCSVCHHDAKANDVWTIAVDGAAAAKAASVRTISVDGAAAAVAAKHKRNAWTITMGAGDNPRRHPCHRSHALHEPAATASAGGVSEIAVVPPAASLDPRGALRLGPVAFRIPVASRLSSRQLQPPVSFLGKQVVPSRW